MSDTRLWVEVGVTPELLELMDRFRSVLGMSRSSFVRMTMESYFRPHVERLNREREGMTKHGIR